MIADEIFKQIDAGRAGENHGYSMGLPKLEGIIDGVTKETYTLVLSNSGAGKSSFALYAYVYLYINKTFNLTINLNRMNAFFSNHCFSPLLFVILLYIKSK